MAPIGSGERHAGRRSKRQRRQRASTCGWPAGPAALPGTPPGSPTASCRPIWRSCRRLGATTSCASARPIRSRARCSACPIRATPHISAARRRPRHPHRPAALPGLARRRAGRASRPTSARVWRDDLVGFAHRLLVLVRGGADGGRHRGAPHRLRLQRADVPHQHRHARRPAVSTGRWWCRCGR